MNERRGTAKAPSFSDRTGRRLTAREDAILRLLVRARSNREVASTLGVSEDTVKVQMRSSTRKLGVKSRLQLATRVLRE